jgi:hypothetical protein
MLASRRSDSSYSDQSEGSEQDETTSSSQEEERDDEEEVNWCLCFAIFERELVG